MQENQLNNVNTLNLQDYSLMCECSLEVAKFGLLTEFIRKGVTDFYSFKSKREDLAKEEMQVLAEKIHELEEFFSLLIAKSIK